MATTGTPEERMAPTAAPEPEAGFEAKADGLSGTTLRPGDFVSYQRRHFGKLQEYMADRGRWTLQLADGRLCAAKAEHLERTPFEPFARVEIVGADCGPLVGMCGEITGYLPERQRWTLKLDVGRDAAARTDQLKLTDKPKPEDDGVGQHSCSCSSEGDRQPNDGEHPENCLDSSDAPQLPGLSEADQALVSLVAKDGANADDWDKKSFQLHAAALEKRAAAVAAGQEAPEQLASRTGPELAARWAAIAPVCLELCRCHLLARALTIAPSHSFVLKVQLVLSTHMPCATVRPFGSCYRNTLRPIQTCLVDTPVAHVRQSQPATCTML